MESQLNRGNTMPRPYESQKRWKKENALQLKVEINRNQNPELYSLFLAIDGSRGTLAREMLEYARKNMPSLQTKSPD